MNNKQLIKDLLNEFENHDLKECMWGYLEEFESFKDFNISTVETFGGEGMGDSYYHIYELEKGNETYYVKFDGYYSSYDGSSFQRWFFVEPKEVTVTKYKEVQ